MRILSQTLQQFVQAVNDGKSVRLNGAGEWTADNFFVSSLRRLFAFGVPGIVHVAESLISIFDHLEEVPVRFGAPQVVDFKGYLIAAESVSERLKQYPYPITMNTRLHLMRRIAALRYRLEAENGGWDADRAFPSDVLELNMHASLWKRSSDLFHHHELTNDEVTKLLETARYHVFTTLLLSDDKLRDAFFIFALRDCHEVVFFIQFPGLQQKLLSSNMQGRIGRMGSDWLKIVRRPLDMAIGQEKIVTLPFEGTAQNILDPNAKVQLRGNYILTIEEVFDVFRKKNCEVGNLEFMSNGIANWNVHQLGWWNADSSSYESVSLLDKEWWKPLPLFEVISKEEAQERYGSHLNGTNWNAAATSTRGSATLDYEQSHAYLELAIPVGHHTYAIYDFGKFAIKFPSTFFESLSMFCHTVHATVAYPDENVYYSHRQHAQHSFALTRTQGYQMLELIRLDLVKARAGNFVYQIESENCAKWLHEKIEQVFGSLYNLFVMKLLDTEPFGFVAWIFGGIRYLPKSWQIPTLMFFHLLLGAYHETWILENNRYICKSLRTHRFWNTGEVYLPAYLHRQLEEGSLGIVATMQVVCQSIRNKFKTFRHNSLRAYGKYDNAFHPIRKALSCSAYLLFCHRLFPMLLAFFEALYSKYTTVTSCRQLVDYTAVPIDSGTCH